MTRQAILGAIFAIAITTVASAQTFKMTTPIAPGVAVPDKLESSIGTLNLNYGYPTAETVEKIYDNLDRSRALQAYLLAIPIVNQAGMRDSIRKFGPDNQTDVHLGRPGRSEDRRADGERQHDLQLHLGRHQQGAVGGRDPAQGAGAGQRLLVSSGWPTSASPAPTRARAASTSCCRLDTRARSRRAITSSGRAPSATGSSSAPSSSTVRPSPASSR